MAWIASKSISIYDYRFYWPESNDKIAYIMTGIRAYIKIHWNLQNVQQ